MGLESPPLRESPRDSKLGLRSTADFRTNTLKARSTHFREIVLSKRNNFPSLIS